MFNIEFLLIPRPSTEPPLFSRWYPGDRLSAHQNVHAAQEHRGQTAAVLQVRSVLAPVPEASARGAGVSKSPQPVLSSTAHSRSALGIRSLCAGNEARAGVAVETISPAPALRSLPWPPTGLLIAHQ